nr:hypothetical protein CFP56_36249 [Quercus suber]
MKEAKGDKDARVDGEKGSNSTLASRFDTSTTTCGTLPASTACAKVALSCVAAASVDDGAAAMFTYLALSLLAEASHAYGRLDLSAARERFDVMLHDRVRSPPPTPSAMHTRLGAPSLRVPMAEKRAFAAGLSPSSSSSRGARIVQSGGPLDAQYVLRDSLTRGGMGEMGALSCRIAVAGSRHVRVVPGA